MDYTVYVKLDAEGHITAVNSSAFLADTEGWTEIDRGFGDRYHHAQGNYFPEPIVTEDGAWRYRLEGGAAQEVGAEELARHAAARRAEETRWQRTAQLRATDAEVIDALEGLLGCTSLTDFLAALVSAGEALKDTLDKRRSLRTEIAALAAGKEE